MADKQPEVFNIDVPPKFRPLFHRAVEAPAWEDGTLHWMEFDENVNTIDEDGNIIPDSELHRYGHTRKLFYIMYGGRGGGKSEQLALAAIQRSFEVTGVILCCRELMSSLKDSLYQVLKSWIHKLGMDKAFDFVEHEIRNKVSGSRFLFRGLKTNFSEIKSTSSIELCIIDEADNITEESLNDLIPTIRTEGAEFFIAFNVTVKDCYVYKRFVLNPDFECYSWKVNIHDNPLAPNLLWRLHDIDKRRAEATGNWNTFNKVWLGIPLEAEDGGIFKPENIKIVSVAPICVRQVRGWDFASSAVSEKNKDPDYTAGGLIGITAEGQYVIKDLVHFRDTPDVVERVLLSTTTQDGLSVEQSIPIDPGQAGKAQVLNMTRKLSGYRVHSSPESGPKTTRAEPFASQVNVGNVVMVAGSFTELVINQMRSFNGDPKRKDDVIDCLARGFNRLQTPYVASLVNIRGL